MKEKEKPDTFQQSKTASIFVSNKQKHEKEKIENTTNSWINQPEEMKIQPQSNQIQPMKQLKQIHNQNNLNHLIAKN